MVLFRSQERVAVVSAYSGDEDQAELLVRCRELCRDYNDVGP